MGGKRAESGVLVMAGGKDAGNLFSIRILHLLIRVSWNELYIKLLSYTIYIQALAG